MTFDEIYRQGIRELSDAGIVDAKSDTLLMIDDIFEVNKGWLLSHGNEEAPEDGYTTFLTYLDRRKKREPLQHILGYQYFMGLKFKINEHVLVPRFDTEILVEEALKYIHGGMSILDMCTGSGCILISLLYYSNECRGLGIDISKEALLVAQSNSDELLKEKDNINYSYANSNLFDDIKDASSFGYTNGEKFDIIVSNPPYIASSVIDDLSIEVKEHDPLIALDGGEDGLYFYRRIVNEIPAYLKRGGMLLFEIGFDQGEDVSLLMKQAGLSDINITKDYSGHDRVISGRMPF